MNWPEATPVSNSLAPAPPAFRSVRSRRPREFGENLSTAKLNTSGFGRAVGLTPAVLLLGQWRSR